VSTPIAILNTGLVTSVGLSAPAACAAIRAGLTNPSETRFIDSSGEWIMAHQVPLEQPWRGRTKLVKMAVMAITECLANVPQTEWSKIPLLLCVAERERPGRLDGLDEELFAEVQQEMGIEFSDKSLVVPHGRVSVGIALMHARRMISEQAVSHVLIAATDSLISWPTLSVYEREDRLLTPTNSNGFMPGEGAGALLVGAPEKGPHLMCAGLGFATEPAHIDSDQPLLGVGLTKAIKDALVDAGCEMHDMDFRITDISGEQYYFKEAALALSRTLRVRKEEFDIWHPAECIGEAGALAGVATAIVSKAACLKAYARGPNVLFHAASDGGQRCAAVYRFQVAA
jgi:3-oxoacyl-[acyl-carrier-protein] synthase-1